MRLEKVFTHKIIRLLRLVLPVVVLILIAVPAWNYLVTFRQTGDSQKPEALPKDLALRTENFTFSSTEGGRTIFTIRAKTNLGTTDQKNMLEDVDVTIHGEKETDPPRAIKSKQCNYDQQTNNFRCTGAVQIQLDDRTQVTTEEVTYNHTDRYISSNTSVDLERPGELAGEANVLEYSLNGGLLSLKGDVKLRTHDGVELNSGSATLQEKENWATATDGVTLKSGNAWVRGNQARAELEPVTHNPRSVVVEGEVSAESVLSTNDDKWKLRAGWVQTTLSSGLAQHVVAKSNVEVERVSREGTRLLRGGIVEADLTDSGKVDVVEARESPRLDFGAGRSLRSDTIWSTAAGSVTTNERSVLELEQAVIEGTQFKMQLGDIITFETSRRASVRSGELTTWSDVTNAKFNSQSGELVELEQTGRFEFRQRDQHGKAQHVTVTDNGRTVTMQGKPEITDPQRKLTADRIVLNRTDDSVTAISNVMTFANQDGEPLRVMADRAERNGDDVLYTGKVRLWRGNSGSLESDALRASLKDNRFHAEGNVRSNFEGVRATARTFDYDDASGLAHYTGNVKARKQEVNIDAADLTVRFSGKEKTVSEITADRNVVLTKREQRATGDHAVYNASTGQVVLTGSEAEVRDNQGQLARGARVTVNVAGDKMAVLEGSVNQRAASKFKVKK